MSSWNWKKTAVAGTLVLLAGGPVLAHSGDWERGPNWGMGPMMGGWHAPGSMMGYYGRDYMLDRIDGRLAFLKTELKITDEQAPAWNELTEVIRATAKTHNDAMEEMMRAFHSGDFWQRPLPERLDFQQAHMETRLKEIKGVNEAVKAFYAQLSDEQKKVADEIIPPAVGMGAWGGHGPGMMMMR